MACGLSSEEELNRQFYSWEQRGRGWQVWDAPVEIEPPFRPFFGHFHQGATVADDGRKPTLLSSLFDRLKPPAATTPVLLDLPEPAPKHISERSHSAPLVEIQIALPPETKITKDAAGQFLLSLGHVSHPIGFEIVGTSESIVVQMACARPDRQQVREQLAAYFPDAILTEREGYLGALWDEANRATVAVDFGLSHEFMRPLRLYDRFEPDPLAGLIGAMAELGRDEGAVFQILFTPVRHPWSESIMRAVTDGEGDSFFADDPAMVKLAIEKTSSPLFAAVVRIAAQSPRAFGKSTWPIPAV